MRRLLIVLAAACIFTTASAATASAQVTGIRHSDGSWTFVDAKGRDIHKDYDARQAARDANLGNRRRTSRPDRESHRVGGYLPWQAR
jgi:Ni/Co efflux regulator RcnB